MGSNVPRLAAALLVAAAGAGLLEAQERGQQSRPRDPEMSYPPALADGKRVATVRSPAFLKPTAPLREGVAIAREEPTVDFLYYPGQDYAGKPWSVWGDGCVEGDRYYSAIGDHNHPQGTAYVFSYDAATRELRMLVDLRKFLESSGAIPSDMLYLPSKIHSRIELGSDGWLYYGTHRGSERATTDANGYRGDWVLRTHPERAETEIVAAYPVPRHSIPTSVLDPGRMIFYGGTAPGRDSPDRDVWFFAYDLRARRMILAAPGGPGRSAILARSTGRLYWNGRMFDPERPDRIFESAAPDARSATAETPQGIVYGTTARSAELWAFDVRTEKVTSLGTAAVAKQEYITSMDADPTGRYLYYVPGAHGKAAADGTPVVQFDTRTRRRKVIAFLHPHLADALGYVPDGTFSAALDPKGEKLYITWNGMRREHPRRWESCALTVVHIPASERPTD